jgi:hypothetical protein
VPGISETQRKNNLRTAMVLAAIATTFFIAVMLKYYWLNS